MWTLVSNTYDYGESDWVMLVFRNSRSKRAEAIYYNCLDPKRTHIGMDVRRNGDPALIEVAEAAIAFLSLTDGHNVGFRVRKL